MSKVFSMQPIGIFKTTQKEGLFHVEAFKKALELALDDLADEAKIEYEKTTATWDEPPEFVIHKNKDNRTILAEGKGGSIYNYIDKGTRVRHAVMSPDFKAKTRPGVVGSGPGRGGVVFVSRKINLPGIEPRGFSEIILARQQRRFPIRMRQVFDDLVYK